MQMVFKVCSLEKNKMGIVRNANIILVLRDFPEFSSYVPEFSIGIFIRESPDGPVVRTLPSIQRGHRFDPLLGN